MPIAGRFWSKVDRQGPNECWEWKAGRTLKNYGQLRLPGRGMVRAHRFAWELTNGPIPDGLCVLHHCDNRPCCNPDHLFLGTHAENAADCREKGRTPRGDRHGSKTCPDRVLRGSDHGCAKLNEDQIPYIRALCEGGLSQRDVARAYGTCQATIRDIVSRRKWSHV